jgi:aryl-alcohol dehydrogenase-like predicted oxidoreductase
MLNQLLADAAGIQQMPKTLLLGTALWGWGIEKSEAHSMLDEFATFGGTLVDCATNYPINGNQVNHGLALGIFSEWLHSNPGTGVGLFVKVGSLDNSGSAESNLSPSFLETEVGLLRDLLGTNLKGVGVHWDNRGSESSDLEGIAATTAFFSRLHEEGLRIGFSGVRHPGLYLSTAPALCRSWWIQVKENALNQSARSEYELHFPKANYLAYGINFGGVKLGEIPGEKSSARLRKVASGDEYQKEIIAALKAIRIPGQAEPTLHQRTLRHAHDNDKLSGVLIGPRSLQQLIDTLELWKQLSGIRGQ